MTPLRFAGVDRLERCDVVVVGSGVAGLSCALAAVPARVALVSKDPVGAGGSTPLAQGGIAAAVGHDDDADLHARDTERVAAGLADPEAVALLTRGAAPAIAELVALGARLDRASSGELSRGREAGHSRHRIVHAGGDATGREVARALTTACLAEERIRTHERTFAWDLVTDGGRVVGVLAVGPEGERLVLLAPAVVLATGGYAAAWSRTTNPSGVTGDGLAMAARAGARLADLEFVQFHPTALAVDAEPMPLLTEALRGRGSSVVDEAGRRFLLADHPDGELAPRDVVARAVRRRLDASHQVFLDAREAVGEALPREFPTVWRLCRAHGLDPRREPLPISPAAHYCMGGILVDVDGRASLPGLWACGEAAATGVHGGNRLASNSLLEGLVFGRRVGEAVLGASPVTAGPSRWPAMPRGADRRGGAELVAKLRATLWLDVGLVRDARGLAHALGELEVWARAAPPEAGELRHLLLVGRLAAAAAGRRRESRGAHYRSDAPRPDPAWRRRLVFTLADAEGRDSELAATATREATG